MQRESERPRRSSEAVTQDPGKVYGYGSALELYLAAGWPSVLPLPVGKKAPPPDGYTGRKHLDTWPTPDQHQRWSQQHPDGNVALRLPPNVVGLDVDAHGDRAGGESFAKLKAEHGELPDTWTVTSREDGVSGIRLFRAQLPAGRRWREKLAGDGIELLHTGHRYAVVWPSIHPTGSVYRWNRPGVPTVAELPELPPAWIDALTEDEAPITPAPASVGNGLLLPFTAPARTFTTDQARRYVWEQAILPLRRAPDGQINNTLNASAMVVGHFVPHFATEDQATAVLMDALAYTVYDGRTWLAEETIPSGLRAGMAEPYTVTDEPAAEREPTHSRRVDLGPYLDGTYVPPEPSIGAERDDNVRLLYPAKWHTVIGLTGCGKSWFAVWQAVAELAAGNTVVYLHFEEAGPAPTLARFLSLGIDQDTLRDRLVWLDASEAWTREQFTAALAELDPAPTLVILDGINAACSLHGWAHEKPEGVGAYIVTFVKPSTGVGAAVLSLGHPVKDRTRQTERHGYGSGDWLNLADGVGFRLEPAQRPIHRGSLGGARLYSVKDRAGGVERHGALNQAREAGWWFLGTFQVDDTVSALDLDDGPHRTAAWLQAPTKELTASGTGDDVDTLADAIVGCLERHGGRYVSKNRLAEQLRADRVDFSNDDLGPALDRLQDQKRLEREPERRGRPRAGWLPDHSATGPDHLTGQGGPDHLSA
jgi:hypothetical protein